MKNDDFDPRDFKRAVPQEERFFEEKNPYGEEERWWWIFQNPLGVMVLAAIAILLVIGLWFVFQPSSNTVNTANEVRVVKADQQPYKEVPDSNTNTLVENHDKEVYKRLGQQAEEQDTPENVVTEQEKPLELSELPQSSSEVDENRERTEPSDSLRKVTESVGVKMPNPVLNEQFIAEKKVEPASSTNEKPQTNEEVQIPKKELVEKNKAAKGLNPGVYAIRVASFRKIETAEREKVRLFNTLGTALNGVGCIVKAIESDSGTFYTVTIGAFPTLTKAKQIAALLKEKNFSAVIQKVNG